MPWASARVKSGVGDNAFLYFASSNRIGAFPLGHIRLPGEGRGRVGKVRMVELRPLRRSFPTWALAFAGKQMVPNGTKVDQGWIDGEGRRIRQPVGPGKAGPYGPALPCRPGKNAPYERS